MSKRGEGGKGEREAEGGRERKGKGEIIKLIIPHHCRTEPFEWWREPLRLGEKIEEDLNSIILLLYK